MKIVHAASRRLSKIQATGLWFSNNRMTGPMINYGFLVMLGMTDRSKTKLYLKVKHVKGGQCLTLLMDFFFKFIIKARVRRLYRRGSLLLVDPHDREDRHCRTRSSTLYLLAPALGRLTLVDYRKPQEESNPQASGEENVLPADTITVTPKKKGVK